MYVREIQIDGLHYGLVAHKQMQPHALPENTFTWCTQANQYNYNVYFIPQIWSTFYPTNSFQYKSLLVCTAEPTLWRLRVKGHHNFWSHSPTSCKWGYRILRFQTCEERYFINSYVPAKQYNIVIQYIVILFQLLHWKSSLACTSSKYLQQYFSASSP